MEIQSGAVAKSYMRKCANISPYMRRPLVIYMTLQLFHSEFPYIWGNFFFLFYQCGLPDVAGLPCCAAGTLASHRPPRRNTCSGLYPWRTIHNNLTIPSLKISNTWRVPFFRDQEGTRCYVRVYPIHTVFYIICMIVLS